jgi:hypothetical protein
MGFTLNYTGSTTAGQYEDEAFEVFETVSLWIDGDMVAEFDASDEDDYLEEDDGTFRFSNLGLIVREDEEVDIIVAVTVVNNVDGADDDDTNDWTIDFTDARVFDADGVAVNENIAEPAVSFEIVEEGDGDELDLRSSSQDPDQATIAVSEGD